MNDNPGVATREELAEFLHQFSDDVIERIARLLTTETAYNLLRDLSYEEHVAVVRKVLQGHFGRMN